MPKRKQCPEWKGKGPKAQTARNPPPQRAALTEGALAENRRLAAVRGDIATVRFLTWLAILCVAVTALVNLDNLPLVLLGIAVIVAIGLIGRARARFLQSQLAPRGLERIDAGALPAEERAPLSERQLALLRQLQDASTRLNRLYRLSLIVGVGSLIAPLPVGLLLGTFVDPSAAFFCFPACCMLGIICLGGIYSRGNQAAKEARQLVEDAGPEAVGAVVDFVEAADDTMRASVLPALTDMLRRLRASDAPFVSPAQRRTLYEWLKPQKARRQPGLALAILHMIEQFGDVAAEPHVRDLASTSYIHDRRDQELITAAFMTLESLKQSGERLSIRGTLLSPAQAPSDLDAVLLRAFVAAGSTPAEQLLRPPASSD